MSYALFPTVLDLSVLAFHLRPLPFKSESHEVSSYACDRAATGSDIIELGRTL